MVLCISRVLADDPTITVVDVMVSAYMGVPIVAASSTTNITDVSAMLNAQITSIGGGNVTCRGFDWGYASGNYTASWNETGTFEVGAFSHNISGLESEAQVFWRAFAVNDQGQGNSTELSFWTVALPDAPTNFTITQVGDTIVNIGWTMGNRADSTIIRGASNGYPANMEGGYPVYSGNGTSVVVDSLNLDTSAYYYRAWSQNEYGYSVNYAEAYVGNPIGLPGIVFALGLCGFALWKKDWLRILLSICIIIWGAFAMPYDIKIGAPLIAIGTILLAIGVMHRIRAGGEQEV